MKMFKKLYFVWFYMIVVSLMAAVAHTDVIKPVSVTGSIAGDAGSSDQWLLNDNAGYAAPGLERPLGTGNTLDTGDSLADALATLAQLSGGGHAESWTFGTGGGNPEFVFDLTGVGNTSIGSIILWQYGNNGGPGTDNCGNHTREFELIFHTEAEGATFNFGTETVEFADTMVPVYADDTSGNVAQHFLFDSQVSVRYVALRIASNYLPPADLLITVGGDRYGLGEVRFATEAPLPSTEPTNPVPGDNETDLPVITDADPGTSSETTLSWTAPAAYTSTGYDVWFGTEPNELHPDYDMIKIKQYASFTGTAVDPLIYYTTDFGQDWYDSEKTKLDYETTYHWYVVAYEGTTPHASSSWSFTTKAEPGTEPPGVVNTRCSGFYLGDINSNCRVGLSDLAILISNWLDDSACNSYNCGDLDENGEVNLFDFALLTNQWQQEVTVVINEFLASNVNETTGLKDEDGTTSDWIELRNYASYSINLDGWFLTDNKNDLNKWRIPAITMAPGEFKIIFASGKDRSNPGSELHTNFVLSISGEYLALVQPDGQTVAYKYSDVPIQYEDVSFGLAIRENEHLLTENYFLSPTPNDVNGTAYPNLGPIISNVIHLPQRPTDSDDLVVTAQITERQKSVASAQLIYRIMYGSETTISMVDDGSGADATGSDGIYTAVIPASASSPSEMVRYAIQTEDSSGGQNRLPLVLDLIGTSQSPEYFGTVVSDPGVTSDLTIMEWFTTSESASHTRTGARASVYYQGQFYDNMYVRQRGQATNAYSQKFNFNKGYDFYINEKLDKVGEVNMNAQGADSAYIRQSLAFNTYEWCGTPSCESFLVLMQLNGSFDRVGVLIEQVDEDFLQRYGRNSDGALYKFVQRSGESESTTDPRFYPYLPHTPCFSDSDNGIEKKTREWEDFSDLQAVVDGLMATTEEERRRFVFDNFNVPEMMSYFAGRAIANDCDIRGKTSTSIVIPTEPENGKSIPGIMTLPLEFMETAGRTGIIRFSATRNISKPAPCSGTCSSM
jgi:hypothetical protein